MRSHRRWHATSAAIITKTTMKKYFEMNPAQANLRMPVLHRAADFSVAKKSPAVGSSESGGAAAGAWDSGSVRL
jgi:hypothetical protein